MSQNSAPFEASPQKTALLAARRATAEDVPSLVELRALLFAERNVSGEGWQEAAAAWFADHLEHPGVGIFVVDAGDDVVACAVGTARDLIPSPEMGSAQDVLVSNVYTRPEARGMGAAKLAFAAVMEWAQGIGAGRVELMATPAGRGIYERHGFTESTFPAMRKSLG